MATAGVGPPRGRGGGEGGRLVRPSLSESSPGKSKPLRSLQPHFPARKSRSAPPPHLVPTAGRRLLPPLLLRRPRARAETRRWKPGENCQGRRSARRLPATPVPPLRSEGQTLAEGAESRGQSSASSELGRLCAAPAPRAGPAPAAHT